MPPMLVRLLADRAGSNALEYGLILALGSLAIILGAAAVANQLDVVFRYLADMFASITATIHF
jgi:Flp pilus assembly pilin Flp